MAICIIRMLSVTALSQIFSNQSNKDEGVQNLKYEFDSNIGGIMGYAISFFLISDIDETKIRISFLVTLSLWKLSN